MTDTTTSPATPPLAATLGEIATRHPGAPAVLEAFGLDYCCGGDATLADAAAAAGVDAHEVVAALADLGDDAPEPWAHLGPAELVDHLEATHHRHLDAELPRLGALLDKVVGVHGARHRELADVQRCFEELRAELEPHLVKEERILFPMVRELATATSAPAFHCGTLRNPISQMLREHGRAGELLAELRDRTGDFTPPPDACASFTALYDGLGALELDTHLHVHKENHVLFPAVLELEHRLGGA